MKNEPDIQYGTDQGQQQLDDHSQSEREKMDLSQLTFEEAMKELEDIVEQLEKGEVDLEKAVSLFQAGMELSASCHQKLEKVEKQVHMLLEEEGQLMQKEFDLEEDPS